MQRSLLLGCGNSRQKKVYLNGSSAWAGELTTMDMNPNCGADVVWDLEKRPLPFEDNTFDEMGAFDVLEHIGKTGDWRGYFEEFAEYWRILKPGGTFYIIVPIGQDAFADPGHTRFFGKTWFAFLSQENYRINLEKGLPITDYRWIWRLNFDILFVEQQGDHHLGVILRKA